MNYINSKKFSNTENQKNIYTNNSKSQFQMSTLGINLRGNVFEVMI